MGGRPSGPCGYEFKEAFTCWHNESRQEEPNFPNCVEQFYKLQKCEAQYPDVYGVMTPEEEEEEIKEIEEDFNDNLTDGSKKDSEKTTEDS